MNTSNLTVSLSHAKNPDIFGGYWEAPSELGRKRIVPVSSLQEASKVCREYIDRNHLGGGNWTGGQISQGGKEIARVSYNGRIWEAVEVGGKELVCAY